MKNVILSMVLTLILCFALVFIFTACKKADSPDHTGTEGLEFYPLNDTDCAVAFGTAIFQKDIVVPAKYKDYTVTTVLGSALWATPSVAKIETVTLPETIKVIEDSAFNGLKSLKAITIPDGVTSIGEYAFHECYNLTTLTIPNSIVSIGKNAFFNCYKLVEVINKSSLNITAGSSSYGCIGYYAKEILTDEKRLVNQDDYLFYTYQSENYLIGYLGDDTELILPQSYNGENYRIRSYSFYECTNLTSVTIPDSVTNIGNQSFYNCYSLTKVTIGNAVTSIGNKAFSNCDSLTSVTIPDSVIGIGYHAFEHCHSLTSIKYRGTEEEWNAIEKYFGWVSDTGNYTITYNYTGE